MGYIYKCQIENGYEKVKLTKGEIKDLNIVSNWKVRNEFYRDRNSIVIHRFDSVWVKLLNTLMIPIVLVLNLAKVVVKLIEDFIEEYYRMIFAKKTGNFVVDRRYLNKKDREAIDKILLKQNLNK